jgi:hypothetical protein
MSMELRDVDRDLGFERRRTLDPHREHASSLTQLSDLLLRPEDPATLELAFTESLSKIALSIAEHFPENIYWDLDFLAAQLIAQGRDLIAKSAESEVEAIANMRELTALFVEVQARYGARSAIHFRYVHDFIYGYDWARWVARAPESRTTVGPYDAVFLQRMRDRAEELLELIAADDSTYPRLGEGVTRNPFGFSREPADESALWAELARSRLIPVEAWRRDPVPTWNRPYAELRETCARELGLVRI